ncbi:MAG: hypothetical protein IPL90_03035 [Holophagales bacterium]|nr:hypothetical protein [Holophagales bacterium]
MGAAFATGLSLGGTVGSLTVRSLGSFLTTTATHAVVAPGLLVHATGREQGDPGSPLFEVAMTYMIVAGVMNVLLAFDAWDVAGERKP